MFWYYGIPYHVYLQTNTTWKWPNNKWSYVIGPCGLHWYFFTSVSPQFIQKHSLKFHSKQYNEWESGDSVQQITGEIGYM